MDSRLYLNTQYKFAWDNFGSVYESLFQDIRNYYGGSNFWTSEVQGIYEVNGSTIGVHVEGLM